MKTEEMGQETVQREMRGRNESKTEEISGRKWEKLERTQAKANEANGAAWGRDTNVGRGAYRLTLLKSNDSLSRMGRGIAGAASAEAIGRGKEGKKRGNERE